MLNGVGNGMLNGVGNDQDSGVGNYLIFRALGIGFISLLIGFVYNYRNKLISDPLVFYPAYCMAILICLSPFAFSILMMAFVPAVIMSTFLTSRFSTIGKHLFETYQTSTHSVGSKSS
jgi:vacuolar-type H+-ATPase subunit I/STV1